MDAEVLLLVIAGSLLRVLIGVHKSMEKGVIIDSRRVYLTFLISAIAGFVAVLMIDTSVLENKFLIIALAFGGIDAIEAAYKFVVRKFFGAAGSIDYGAGYSSNYRNLTVRQRRAVDFLRNSGRMKNDDYQKINRVSHRTAVRDLESLAAMGVVKIRGTGKSTYYELA